MKQFYVLFLFFINFSVSSQIIEFPDAAFKAKLLSAAVNNGTAMNAASANIKIDVNNNQEIEVSEALAVYRLNISYSEITSVEGIQFFTNLTFLVCKDNQIESLDLTMFPNLTGVNATNNALTSLNIAGLSALTWVECHNSQLTGINLDGVTNLQSLACANNQITSFDFSDTPNLTSLFCRSNQLAELDLSGLTQLTALDCAHNFLTDLNLSSNPLTSAIFCHDNQLVTLNVKNGNPCPFSTDFSNNPGLLYICTDGIDTTVIQNKINLYNYTNCNFNGYCSFVPGGDFYTISGENIFDIDNDGCDTDDLFYPYLKLYTDDGVNASTLICNETGNYSFGVQDGQHIVVPFTDNAYFTVIPEEFTVSFPEDGDAAVANFCITANGTHNDLEIVVFPLNALFAGEDSAYRIVLRNVGTTVQDGTVSFNFDDSKSDFIGSNPIGQTPGSGVITWNFLTLQPFASYYADVFFSNNGPMDTPSVNLDDVFTFSVSVVGLDTDETPSNNEFIFNQVVVNSFDPNSTTCLEGSSVSPAIVGNYVHYIIRFENDGSANANNIVVKDVINTSRFAIGTLTPIVGSHSFTTRITGNNAVEFIFENIDLPFDDANNDGFVLFKIKTKPTLVVGNSFSNASSIYFDHNFPIVTNTATTTISALGNLKFEAHDFYTIHPNPTNATLNISNPNEVEVQTISIFNMLGQQVIVIPNPRDVLAIDVSTLQSGSYFMKVTTDKGTSAARFIKN